MTAPRDAFGDTVHALYKGHRDKRGDYKQAAVCVCALASGILCTTLEYVGRRVPGLSQYKRTPLFQLEKLR